MAAIYKLLWSSTKCTFKDVTQIANTLNLNIPKASHVIIIQITESWWGISGDPTAEKHYNKVMKYLNAEVEA